MHGDTGGWIARVGRDNADKGLGTGRCRLWEELTSIELKFNTKAWSGNAIHLNM